MIDLNRIGGGSKLLNYILNKAKTLPKNTNNKQNKDVKKPK